MRKRLLAASMWVGLTIVLGLWIRSYAVEDRLAWFGGGGSQKAAELTHLECATQQGRLRLVANHYWFAPDSHLRRGFFLSSTRLLRKEPPPSASTKTFLGFEVTLENQRKSPATMSSIPNGKTRLIVIPLWFLATLLVIPLSRLSYAMWRSRREQLKTLCRTCGYDMRATPARCPECGCEPDP